MDRNRIHSLIRLLASLLILSGITFLYRAIFPGVNSTTIALTFLLAILGIATAWGLFEAIVSSIIGMLCFNFFFLPPVGKFTVEDPQNYVALFVFLVTAVVASQLSLSVKKRALEAIRRQEEVERLYELSRDLMLLDNQMAIAEQVADRIAQIFDLPAVAVFDRARDRLYRTDLKDQSISDARLRDVSLQGSAFHDSLAKQSVVPLNL